MYQYRVIRIGTRGEVMEEDDGGFSRPLDLPYPDLLTYLNKCGKEGWHVIMSFDAASGIYRLLLEKSRSE